MSDAAPDPGPPHGRRKVRRRVRVADAHRPHGSPFGKVWRRLKRRWVSYLIWGGYIAVGVGLTYYLLDKGIRGDAPPTEANRP